MVASAAAPPLVRTKPKSLLTAGLAAAVVGAAAIFSVFFHARGPSPTRINPSFYPPPVPQIYNATPLPVVPRQPTVVIVPERPLVESFDVRSPTRFQERSGENTITSDPHRSHERNH